MERAQISNVGLSRSQNGAEETRFEMTAREQTAASPQPPGPPPLFLRKESSGLHIPGFH